MTNPVLVEAVRGALIESGHRGAAAVTDADGARVLALGDVARPIYPRSAVKALQALPLVESGAAECYGLGDEDLARACATASALHNNCSGKHAGFLCLAGAMGVDHRGYVAAAHPVQRAVKAALEDLAGTGLDACATDGCSVPTWAVPLADLARAFARFGTGAGLAPERARAAARLRAACAAKPYYVAGTGRFCTEAMQRFGPRLLLKTGAEGTFCAALPAE